MEMWNTIKFIAEGIPITIIITIFSIILAFIFTIFVTAAQQLGGKITQLIIKGYITFITGTPLLFQLFIIYYGPSQFAFVRESEALEFLMNPWFSAFAALVINSTAYTTQLLVGAFNNIDKGQVQVSESMGLTRSQVFFLMLPYAIRRFLPPYINEAVYLLKSTSLVTTVTLLDVMAQARQLYSETYDAITAFGVAAIMYLILSFIILSLFKILEKNWLKYCV